MRIEICKNVGVKTQKQMEYIFHYKKLKHYDNWKKYCLKDQIKKELKSDSEIPKLDYKVGSENYNPVWKKGYYADM